LPNSCNKELCHEKAVVGEGVIYKASLKFWQPCMPLPRILVRILLDCKHVIMWINFILAEMQVKWTSAELEQYKQFILCGCHVVLLMQTASFPLRRLCGHVHRVPGNH